MGIAVFTRHPSKPWACAMVPCNTHLPARPAILLCPAGQEEYCLDLQLHAPVVPEESRFAVLGSKIEIKLKKAVAGTQWPGLEAGAAAAAPGSPAPAAPAAAAPAAGEAGAAPAPAPAGPSLAYPYAG